MFVTMKSFSFLKSLPVKKDEVSKFLLSSIMMVMIIAVYSIQRGLKDSLVVTYMGAELLSTIKLFGVLPMAFVFVLMYTKLLDVLTKTSVFHVMNVIFLSYFLFFTFVLHPNFHHLKLDLSFLSSPTLKYLFIMLENWHLSLFYIFAEIWGSVMLALLFWQTCNQIFKTEQAKRIYPLIGFSAQFGLLVSGTITKGFASKASSDWQNSLENINISAFICGLILSLAYWYLTSKLVDKKQFNATESKKKHKPGLINSLKFVFSSKYVLLIASIIVCYGVSINLVEGIWKKYAGVLYSTPSQYANFMGDVQIYTAFFTMAFMLIGSYALSRISWKTAAILTPIMIGVTGALFFSFLVFEKQLLIVCAILGCAPIILSVYSGFAQNFLSKSVKYSFFDATKEMSYIPLDDELRTKGKAAADVIGGRFGKSGGSIVQFTLLAVFPGSNLMDLAPSLFVMFAIIMIVWFFAVGGLSKQYEILTKNN